MLWIAKAEEEVNKNEIRDKKVYESKAWEEEEEDEEEKKGKRKCYWRITMAIHYDREQTPVP